jgi:hypothetical protein
MATMGRGHGVENGLVDVRTGPTSHVEKNDVGNGGRQQGKGTGVATAFVGCVGGGGGRWQGEGRTPPPRAGSGRSKGGGVGSRGAGEWICTCMRRQEAHVLVECRSHYKHTVYLWSVDRIISIPCTCGVSIAL